MIFDNLIAILAIVGGLLGALLAYAGVRLRVFSRIKTDPVVFQLKKDVEENTRKLKALENQSNKRHNKDPLRDELESIYAGWILRNGSDLSAALATYMVVNVIKVFDLIAKPKFDLKSYQVAESVINGMRKISRIKSKLDLPFNDLEHQFFISIVDRNINDFLYQLRLMAEDNIENAKYERLQKHFLEYAIAYKSDILEFLENIEKGKFKNPQKNE